MLAGFSAQPAHNKTPLHQVKKMATQQIYTFTNGYDHISKNYSFQGGTVIKSIGDAFLVQLKKEWGGSDKLALFTTNKASSIRQGDIVGSSDMWWAGKTTSGLLSTYKTEKSPAKAIGSILPFSPGPNEIVLAAKQDPENYNNYYDSSWMIKFPPGASSSSNINSPKWLTNTNGAIKEYWYTSFTGSYDKYNMPIFGKSASLKSRALSKEQVLSAEIVYNADINNDGTINRIPSSIDKDLYKLNPGIDLLAAYKAGNATQIAYPFREKGSFLYNEEEWKSINKKIPYNINNQSREEDVKFKWMNVRGSSKDDVLIGGIYTDFIDGGDGDDIIYGGSRYNVSNGDPFWPSGNRGAGNYNWANDVLTGGKGKDTFILNIANVTWVTDFSPSEDKIVLYSEKGNGVGGSTSIQPPTFNQIGVVDRGNGAVELLDQNGNRFAFLQGFALNPGDLTQKMAIFS